MAALHEPSPARVIAMQNAMHLADIRATHAEKYGSEGIVSAEDIVKDANTFLDYYTAVPNG